MGLGRGNFTIVIQLMTWYLFGPIRTLCSRWPTTACERGTAMAFATGVPKPEAFYGYLSEY
jgi:hypothetical protein